MWILAIVCWSMPSGVDLFHYVDPRYSMLIHTMVYWPTPWCVPWRVGACHGVYVCVPACMHAYMCVCVYHGVCVGGSHGVCVGLYHGVLVQHSVHVIEHSLLQLISGGSPHLTPLFSHTEPRYRFSLIVVSLARCVGVSEHRVRH